MYSHLVQLKEFSLTGHTGHLVSLLTDNMISILHRGTAQTMHTNTQKSINTNLLGIMFHLIRNVNYLSFVLTVAVCLPPPESCDRNQEGGVVPMTLEPFASSLPPAVPLSPSRKMEECL